MEAVTRSCAARTVLLAVSFVVNLVILVALNVAILLTLPFPMLSYQVAAFAFETFARGCVFTMQRIIGAKVELAGDDFISGEPSLLIANHQTFIDFLITFIVLLPKGMVRHGKCFVKKSAQYVPLAGTIFKASKQLIIQRNWERDQRALRESLSFFRLLKVPYVVGMFPEGTRITPKKKAEVGTGVFIDLCSPMRSAKSGFQTFT